MNYSLYFTQQSETIFNFVLMDIWTRKNIVQRGNLCFLCLKGSHLTKDCSSKMKYFNCSEWHHVVLCDLEENTHSLVLIVALVYEVFCWCRWQQILLHTEKISLKNSARVLFDSFSQLSCILPHFLNHLQLKIVAT